jgi:uncharacterized protein YcnI
MKRKWPIVMMLALVLAGGAAGTAFAHVTVQPAEVPQGSYQVFTVRVPTEKASATTEVKIAIPDGVNISRFEPKPGWTYEIERNGDGKIVSVTWKATGPGLAETEFGEFRMQGKVADDATELVWKAYQTYADGEVVEWTGAPDADKPASVTRVTPAAAGADAHGHGGGGQASNAEQTSPAGGARDPLTLGLAVAGLAAGVAALAVSLFRGRRERG